MKAILSLIIVLFLTIVANAAANDRDQIGEVLGQPVYRKQVEETGCSLYMALNILFVHPLLERYCETHKKMLEPTEQEINQWLAYATRQHEALMKDQGAVLKNRVSVINSELGNNNLPPEKKKELEKERDNIIEISLTPPDRDLAISAIKPWKLRLHFYKQYGGGRFIVGPMGGVYPFDSKYNWLKEQEKNGQFKITDPEMREGLYGYWTSMEHGSNLVDDKTTIDNEKILEKILHPDYLAK